MELKTILHQQGTLFVDEQAKGQIGLNYNSILNKVDKLSYPYDEHTTEGKIHYKIIAQHNLNLEGIPYVELEEDVEKLAKEYVEADVKKNPLYGQFYQTFIAGYKTAQPKKYTEEQLIKAIHFGELYNSGSGKKLFEKRGLKPTEAITHFIQSLQPKIESIEVETKGTISNYVAKEIPITYQKDGKTYLKIKKINYDTTRS